MEHIEQILNQYFPAPECRTAWEKWSDNLKGNIATSLTVAVQSGELAESYLKKLQEAVCAGNIQSLMCLTSKPEYKTTTIQHYSVQAPQMLEILIWHKGNTYRLLYGECGAVNSYFLCVPDVHFSCYLGEATELFRNAEKMAVKFDMDTAISFAECIQKVAKIVGKKEQNVDARLSEEQKSILQQPWETAMNLSTRARNALHRVGKRTSVDFWDGKPEDKPLLTVQDVAALSPTEIYRIRNMGVVTRHEISAELKRIGVQSTAWYNV